MIMNEQVAYKGQVYYIARSVSERQDNDDEFSNELPFFFEVDPATLRPVDISLEEIEQQYHTETGETKNLVWSHGWPEIQNQSFVDNLWRRLGGR